MPGVYVCHGIEWFVEDTCIVCDEVKATEQRIIKLLEEHAISAAYASKKPEKEPYVLAWWDAVALIKGENK